jgi:FixJ family two-component response regulator
MTSISNLTVYVIDDDPDFAASLTRLLRSAGYTAEPFSDPGALLDAYALEPADCVVSDVMMGEIDGFAFCEQLQAIDNCVRVIFVTGWPSTSAAVKAVRQFDAADYLEKPVNEEALLQAVARAAAEGCRRREIQRRTAVLTGREQQVLSLLVRGFSTKEIARELDISPRTVEIHRAQIASKTGARTLAAMIALST